MSRDFDFGLKADLAEINIKVHLAVGVEMVECMKRVAAMDTDLSIEERNLLSVAYKNVIGARRASWRIISSIEQKEESKGAEVKLELIRQYRKMVCALLAMVHKFNV